MKSTVLGAVVLLITGVAMAQTPPSGAPAGPPPAPKPAPIAHPAPTSDEAAQIAASDRLTHSVGDQQRAYWFAPAGAMMPYRLFVPTNWDHKSKLPVILVLHGGGTDQNGPFSRDGGQFEKLANERGYIIVAPMGYSAVGGYGVPFQPPTPPNGAKLPPFPTDPKLMALSEGDTFAVLDRTIAEYGADTSRVYLMGNSMGGAGTWYLGEKFAGRWAAISPSDGPPQPDQYPFDRLKGVHVLAVHGELDQLAPIEVTRQMVDRAKAAGADATFMPVKDGEHPTAWIMVMPQIFDFFDAHPRAG